MNKPSILIVTLILISFLFSCNQSQTPGMKPNKDTKLEILYFHTSDRCPACMAIESNTVMVLDEYYKTQIDSGVIIFTSCNIDDKVNKSIVEKYQVSFLTLLIVKKDGTKTDFTTPAFQYADTRPERFIELLKAEIDKNLR